MDLLPMIVLGLSCAVLAAALVSSMVRRRRALRSLEEGVLEEMPLDLVIPEIPLRRISDPTPEDRLAYAVIERHRSRVWWSFRPRTEISVRKLQEIGWEVVREVAAAYHPESERPELKVGFQDLLNLNLRVTQRLCGQMERWPLSVLGGVRLDQALWVREQVRRFRDSRLGTLVDKAVIPYKVGKWAWRVYNAASPWYWGRQVVYTGGREAALRYLLTSLVTFVGEEAVLTYSGRCRGRSGKKSQAADGPVEEEILANAPGE